LRFTAPDHSSTLNTQFDDYRIVELPANCNPQGERTMSDLKGKAAVVTGASKGIGAATAKALAAAGAAVVVNYASDQKGADSVAAAITARGGKAAKYFGPSGGSVINISSVASETATPTASIYSATKGAVDTLSRVLAAELGPRKIRVNVIAPGGVETEGTHAAGVIGSDFEKSMISKTALGRLGQPDDIARIAVFLASDDSGWLTGERVVASGGYF
jgi:NAD(P)-dependent dehydrogenase (short-subunit alcohol dehydrogenase family)